MRDKDDVDERRQHRKPAQPALQASGGGDRASSTASVSERGWNRWLDRHTSHRNLPSLRLFLLSVVLPDSIGQLLSLLQGGVHAGGTGDRRRELLRDLVTQVLKFGNVHVLDAGVGNGVHRWMVDVGMCDRVEGQLGKGPGDLLILGQLVGGRPGAGRYVVPAELGADELDVILRRGPRSEGPGCILLRAGRWHPQRPG